MVFSLERNMRGVFALIFLILLLTFIALLFWGANSSQGSVFGFLLGHTTQTQTISLAGSSQNSPYIIEQPTAAENNAIIAVVVGAALVGVALIVALFDMYVNKNKPLEIEE